MNDTIPNFDRQELTLSNNLWTVDLFFERDVSEKENQLIWDKTVELNEIGNSGSILAIKSISKDSTLKTCLINGIDGGVYLHTADEKDNSCSVKLVDNFLIFSLGFTFFAFDIEKQEIKWKVRPDAAEIFEFYDLSNDFLVRGELQIHRIDKDGNIKWSYGGRDIWVNIDGKQEVKIEENRILLTDFDSNKYIIDFNGKTIEYKPREMQRQNTKRWWKLW